MKLVFAGDPMCSWCYGFGKELTALSERHPDLQLDIVLGGVRAGATDILDDAGKQFRLQHWARVEESSGLPFNRDAFQARQNFVYDTEPVCRAVVVARMLVPAAQLLPVFRALQRAFYVDGADTTDGALLSRVAAEALRELGHDISAEQFHAKWKSPEAITETLADFRHVRALGINSFPALLLQQGDDYVMINPGYTHVDQLDMKLTAAIKQLAAA
ncbi:DsbA family protein [Undibacterium sp.]|uniref:DsbA family protein n=1 Tax=Undibacterium sp. TaxID=1914977 RepID=UPI00374D7705